MYFCSGSLTFNHRAYKAPWFNMFNTYKICLLTSWENFKSTVPLSPILAKFHLSGKNWLLIYKYKKKNSKIPSKCEEIINFC